MAVRQFIVMAAVLAVPGCGQSVSGTAIAADSSVSSAVDQQPPAGTWVGSYDCAQGATGLTLTVQSSGRAEFAFYPLPGNPRAASGRFEMRSSFESDRLVFRQMRWIEQPGSYVMVDLIATHHDATVMSGEVVANGCTTFRLSRDTS